MYYTGFADEAGASIDVQIEATKELGWLSIESRNIDGVNLTDISDEKFDEVTQKLADAGITINCFGSAIANWSRDPRKDEDFQYSVEALKRAIPRMQTLGTEMLRGMSFAVVRDAEPDSPELEKLVFEKVNHLVKMCEDGGVFYMHENCMNYGGMSHEHTLKLLDNVKSPNFKLVFDTANPVFTDRRIGPKPYRKQSSWEFYSNVKEFVEYVHIKDAHYIGESGGIFPRTEHVFPGEGDGDVEKIVKDLLTNGYDGGLSIEPHLAVVFHDDSVQSADDVRYNNYVEYGRRFMQLVAKIETDGK
jgi:sugar phosphate isomerase/epimerase